MFIVPSEPKGLRRSNSWGKSRIHIHLQGKTLKNVSRRLRSRSDPYAIVEAGGISIGRTET